MKENLNELIDDEGRLVRVTRAPDGSVTERYYIGRDCEGVIRQEGSREYVEVEGQKRYWGGIIEPLPNDKRIQRLKEFTVFIIKPDGVRMELIKAVRYLIEKTGDTVATEREFVFTDMTIRKIYPHFFAEEWEADLFEYLKSGPCHCFLVRGRYPHRDMFTLRNAIRHLFRCNSGPKVKSLVHCAQRQSDAVKQSLLFFSLEEVVLSVGLKK